jgi:hypothetical protein
VADISANVATRISNETRIASREAIIAGATTAASAREGSRCNFRWPVPAQSRRQPGVRVHQAQDGDVGRHPWPRRLARPPARADPPRSPRRRCGAVRRSSCAFCRCVDGGASGGWPPGSRSTQ